MADLGFSRRAAAIGALILATGAGGYVMQREPAISPAGLEQLAVLAKATPWASGRMRPVVRVLDGNPWWVVLEGDDDNSSFVNKTGDVLTLHCFRYYARPATATFGNYLKPGSDDHWQERGRDCRETRTAAK